MAKNPKEVAERMTKLHGMRNNVVREIRKVQDDLPQDAKFDGVREALRVLEEFQKQS